MFLLTSAIIFPYVTTVRVRDRHHIVPSLEFRFKFLTPLPNKARIITQKDQLGRIVSSEVALNRPLN